MLINARDAVEDGQWRDPRIRIELDSVEILDVQALPDADLEKGTFARVDISDNGPGIDEAVLSHIFEPFFTTKSVDKGTGLGLSTAFSIVQRHGGWLACESAATGATFSIFLPLTEAATAAPPPVVGGGRTILVIDDEDAVRLSLQRMLEHCDYEVLAAADGLEGLEMFKKARERIALVILDLSMPRMSGEEVLVAFRRLVPDLKVLLFTGYAAAEEEFPGVSGVLQKPFRGEDLVQRVATILAEEKS